MSTSIPRSLFLLSLLGVGVLGCVHPNAPLASSQSMRGTEGQQCQKTCQQVDMVMGALVIASGQWGCVCEARPALGATATATVASAARHGGAAAQALIHIQQAQQASRQWAMSTTRASRRHP